MNAERMETRVQTISISNNAILCRNIYIHTYIPVCALLICVCIANTTHTGEIELVTSQ